jgi:hypothetical protein
LQSARTRHTPTRVCQLSVYCSSAADLPFPKPAWCYPVICPEYGFNLSSSIAANTSVLRRVAPNPATCCTCLINGTGRTDGPVFHPDCCYERCTSNFAPCYWYRIHASCYPSRASAGGSVSPSVCPKILYLVFLYFRRLSTLLA